MFKWEGKSHVRRGMAPQVRGRALSVEKKRKKLFVRSLVDVRCTLRAHCPSRPPLLPSLHARSSSPSLPCSRSPFAATVFSFHGSVMSLATTDHSLRPPPLTHSPRSFSSLPLSPLYSPVPSLPLVCIINRLLVMALCNLAGFTPTQFSSKLLFQISAPFVLACTKPCN